VLRERRAAIVADLGGEKSLLPMELALLNVVVRSHLILSSVDRYLLTLPCWTRALCAQKRDVSYLDIEPLRQLGRLSQLSSCARVRMELSLLAGRPEGWEQEILSLIGRTFFHSSEWLDYVNAAFPSRPVQFVRVTHGAELVGYLCALRAKRLSFEVWGSPFPSAGLYLGPLLRHETDQAEFMAAVAEYCDQSGIAHLILCNDDLRSGVMAALGFRERRGVTLETSLGGGESCVWNFMRGTCRTRIRKAVKSGLEGEVTTDPGVVDEFYELFLRTMQWKRMAPEYDVERPRALFRHLMPTNRLLAARIRHRGRVVAVGLYPHDDHAMYVWDEGYDPELLELSPNELMRWIAIKAATASGLRVFRAGGAPHPSRFAQKFGGTLVPYVVHEKIYNLAYAPLDHALSGLRWARTRWRSFRIGSATRNAREWMPALMFCVLRIVPATVDLIT